MTLTDDFGPEMAQSVTIAPWASNDGFKDTYGTGVARVCAVQYKVQNITKADGTLTVSTMQIYLDGAVTISARDKITFGSVSPKILAVAPDYDIESPSEVYSTIIYT